MIAQRASEKTYWDAVAAMPKPAWYLHPLVAAHKRLEHLRLIRQWMPAVTPQTVLKTDLFDEAFGDSGLMESIAPGAQLRLGIDLALNTARTAASRAFMQEVRVFSADVRRLALRTGSVDLVVSNSTLDHFAGAEDFAQALGELSRVLRPAGRLIITMDNLSNPLYWLLRWASRMSRAPYRLGYTTTAGQLERALGQAGLRPVASATLIHNPRGISTLLFAAMQRILGHAAGPAIEASLKLFAAVGRTPIGRLTACFVAACADKG